MPFSRTSYHHLPINDVFKDLKTSASGLSKKEAASRLKKFGPNSLPETKKLSAFVLFLRQFKNPLIYILFVALIISFVTKHSVDAWIILAVILISSIVGFIQEYKANQALSRLKQMVNHHAKVMRDGRETVVVQEELVAGDIILLSPGDKVPADARLIEARNLEIIEAALTGESNPSNKGLGILAEDTPLADRENTVYFGTVVAGGKAVAVVIATGLSTELGRIASLVRETKEEETPLQRQLVNFGKVIGVALIVANLLIFGLGVLTGRPLFEMFLTSVAVVVAGVPEGLLPAMTVILAIGMQRLAKRKGLVRKMLAAETLGSVSVICSDKTGTLTQGEMRVSEVITETADIIRGKGMPIEGAEDDHGRIRALKIGVLNNNAIIENPEEELQNWIIIGDATEKALLLAGRAAGLKKDDLEKEEPRIAEIPFDSEYKFMATLHKREENYLTYAKGAPEKILKMSSFIEVDGNKIGLAAAEREIIQKQFEELTSSGLRVLAVAYKEEDNIKEPQDFTKERLRDLIFVGLVALKDPLRPNAKHTLELCQKAGLRPIIVTGDHRLTAIAIVRELGVKITEENVLEGADLDAISDGQLKKLVQKTVIFARVEPKHKIRIVSALQANGEVVAMTGDGVNDAPALKKADIGIAVGSGADVAKEVADLVLLDNNFKTIVEAVKRGRIIFGNIRKVILYLLTDSFSEMIIVGGSVILGLPLPILPAQILWIKLVEDAAPAMSLSFDEIDENVMEEAPRKKNEPLLNRRFKALIAFYAIIMDLTLFGLFYYFWRMSGNIDYARTITFVGLGITSLFYVFAVRGLKLSILKINFFSNKFLLATVALGLGLLFTAIYVPFFNDILRTIPLGIKEWLILLGYAVMGVVVYEIGKKITIARISK